MRKIRGRFLVFLLSLAFFAVGCASIDERSEKKPFQESVTVSVVAKKPEPVRVVTKEVPVYRNVGIMEVFVIDGYPIDVSDIQESETKNDLDRLVRKLKSLGPDSVRLMAVKGSCSPEASEKYNYDLGYLRAEKVKKALLESFPEAEIITSTRGERPSRRQVEVFYGASRASILEKVFIEKKGKLTFCDSVTFEINSPTVTIIIDLAQNDIKLEPGTKIRVHLMTKNHRFGHTGDVGAIGEPTGDGKLIFRFPRFTDTDYIERFWFTTSKDKWFKAPCSRFLVPDDKGNLAIQVLISSDSVKPVSADQFLDQVDRHGGRPSDVYTEKEKAYFKKD